MFTKRGLIIAIIMIVSVLPFIQKAGAMELNPANRDKYDKKVIRSADEALAQIGSKLQWVQAKTSPSRKANGGGYDFDLTTRLTSVRLNWNKYYSPVVWDNPLVTDYWIQSTVGKKGSFVIALMDQNGPYAYSVNFTEERIGMYVAQAFRPEIKLSAMQIEWSNGEVILGSSYSDHQCPIGPSLHFWYQEHSDGHISGQVVIDNHSLYQDWTTRGITFWHGVPSFSKEKLTLERELTYYGDGGVIQISTDEAGDNPCALFWWKDLNRR